MQNFKIRQIEKCNIYQNIVVDWWRTRIHRWGSDTERIDTIFSDQHHHHRHQQHSTIILMTTTRNRQRADKYKIENANVIFRLWNFQFSNFVIEFRIWIIFKLGWICSISIKWVVEYFFLNINLTLFSSCLNFLMITIASNSIAFLF